MRVLITGYEAAPFFKRGGLGDVLGSLPKALEKIGIDARVVIPYYEEIRKKHESKKIGSFSVCFGKSIEKIGIYKNYFPRTKVPIYFLENKNLAVINTRGRNKKIDQFAFFDLCVSHFVLWSLEEGKWTPDLVHCNDWHTGLIPLLLHRELRVSIPTLLTIHNLSYQGKGSIRILDLLHVQDQDVKELKRGTPATKINILGEGIIHAGAVSTVSPTYAREVVKNNDHDPIHAFLLKRQKERGAKDEVFGILNGIDYDVWNPRHDGFIGTSYGMSDWKTGKAKNKAYLLRHLGLLDKPTFCFIGRMAYQKGFDTLMKILPSIISLDVNLLFLGAGEKTVEASVMRAAQQYPSAIRAEFSYNERFAHHLYAGCDFILIPSHFEPCGLIQMIAMRYATLPIASKTGGLQDTINSGKNGFLFENGKADQLRKAVIDAMQVYHNHDVYETMVHSAMETDFSWDKSALQYKMLYAKIVDEHAGV